jgi:hypothetical protein
MFDKPPMWSPFRKAEPEPEPSELSWELTKSEVFVDGFNLVVEKYTMNWAWSVYHHETQMSRRGTLEEDKNTTNSEFMAQGQRKAEDAMNKLKKSL